MASEEATAEAQLSTLKNNISAKLDVTKQISTTRKAELARLRSEADAYQKKTGEEAAARAASGAVESAEEEAGRVNGERAKVAELREAEAKMASEEAIFVRSLEVEEKRLVLWNKHRGLEDEVITQKQDVAATNLTLVHEQDVLKRQQEVLQAQKQLQQLEQQRLKKRHQAADAMARSTQQLEHGSHPNEGDATPPTGPKKSKQTDLTMDDMSEIRAQNNKKERPPGYPVGFLENLQGYIQATHTSKDALASLGEFGKKGRSESSAKQLAAKHRSHTATSTRK